MITSILIMLIAFYWLLKETDYLRVRLLVGSDTWRDELPYDIGYTDFDFMDIDSTGNLINEPLKTVWSHTEAQYQAWLKKQREPKLIYNPPDLPQLDRRDRWMAIEEDLAKRRAGEMIYQRR